MSNIKAQTKVHHKRTGISFKDSTPVELYILFKLMLAFSLLLWLMWLLPDSDDDVRFQFHFVAASFGFMALSAILIPKFGQTKWFLWSQMLLDAIYVSALMGATDAIQSPYFVLYCVNIIAAARLLNPNGVLGVALLDSVTYMILAGVFIWQSQIFTSDPLFIYNSVLSRIFGLFLLGILSYSLAIRQQQTQKSLDEQVQQVEIMTKRHEDLLDRIPLALLAVKNNSVEPINVFANDVFGHLDIPKERLNISGERWDLLWHREESQVLLEGRELQLVGGERLILFEDVTRLREIEEKANREDRLAALGRLAASLAHEIRNPLASVSGSVQLLAEKDKSPLHDIILREVKRLNALVENFLASSRPPELQRVYMDPNGIIDEVLVAMKNDDRCAEVHFSYKNEISDRSLYLDPHQFRQILWNILLNAVQAIGGKGKIVLDVSLDPIAAMWTLKISDNGVGIPKEHLSHIFDPFYTTRTGGTGLGLANVEKIVLAHGGRISVISEIEIGSCFIISFPIGRR